MAQNRTHDYRGPRSSENLNRHFAGIVPPGIYRGLDVGVDGTIAPGIVLDAGGIRIEQETATSVVVPAGDATHPRYDLVVCHHEYQKSVPAQEATFEVVEGTPAASPALPNVPADCTLIAICEMAVEGTQWTTVLPAARILAMNNCYFTADNQAHIIHGNQSAMMIVHQLFDENGGEVMVFVKEAGALADGAVIAWGAPQAAITSEGITACLALEISKLDKAGGTLTGPLVCEDTADFQGDVTFNHDDPTAVAFDDWVTFARHVPAAGANSKDWIFNNYYWRAITSGPGTTLIVPVPQYVGAELVSVDVDCDNDDVSIPYDIEIGLSKTPYGNYAGGTDFSEETVSIAAASQEVNNLVVKDPITPFGALPYAFVTTEMLLLRVKTGADKIRFWGARFNYRRKQLAI